MNPVYIDIPLIDISCIPRYTSNRYISRYRYIRLVSLYLLCQIYQNRYRRTVRDIPDCDEDKSKVVRNQIFSTGRMSEIVRSNKPCRIKYQAHLSISRPITARIGFRKWLKNI